jgi:hypothetical protein
VADRFHVLTNLVEVLHQALGREQEAMHTAACVARRNAGAAGERAGAERFVHRRGDTRPRQQARAQAQARRQLRYEACRRLHAQGKGMRELVDELRMGPNTVRRFLRAESCPQRAARAPRRSRLAPFEPYLRERWDAGTLVSRMDGACSPKVGSAATRAAAPICTHCSRSGVLVGGGRVPILARRASPLLHRRR